MMRPGLFALAARFAPRLFQVRRRTWIGVGLGLLLLFGLMIWASVTLLGWIFGQAQVWMGAAPETVRGAVERAEQAVPGVRKTLEDMLPARQTTPAQRDVSGTDLGPVARYPGLVRTFWQRDASQVTIEYQGKADYTAVLDHYAKGFTAKGYAQQVQTATPTVETHIYTKGSERIAVKVAQQPDGLVSARLEMQ